MLSNCFFKTFFSTGCYPEAAIFPQNPGKARELGERAVQSPGEVRGVRAQAGSPPTLSGSQDAMLHMHLRLPVCQSAAAADFPGLGGTGGVKGCTDSSGHFQCVSSLLLWTFSVLFWFWVFGLCVCLEGGVCVCVWGGSPEFSFQSRVFFSRCQLPTPSYPPPLPLLPFHPI